MSEKNDKSKEKIEISYEDFFRTRFNGIVEIFRVLTPLVDRRKALERLKKLWEKKGIETIVRHLKNANPITNFEEFKNVYKDQISTEYMRNCLNFSIIEDTPQKLVLKFTKCLWAKTFLEINAPEIGYAICCYPDFAMAKAFHPNLRLTRTKCLMKGDDYCDSTYIWEE